MSVPPPLVGGLSGVVDIRSVVVETMFLPSRALDSTRLGLFTIAWVTFGMSAGGVRNCEAIPRLVSGNWIGVCGGAIVKGVMLAGPIGGA